MPCSLVAARPQADRPPLVRLRGLTKNYGSMVAVKPLDLDIPVYPVKGYSITAPIIDPERAPRHSLTDESRRIVCSRLGNVLRVAGTAELNGFDLSPNPARSASIVNWLEEHLPGAADIEQAQHWCGLRPATPSNVVVTVQPVGLTAGGGVADLGDDDLETLIGALDRLEAFASAHGAAFYGLPMNRETITLVKEPCAVPRQFAFGDGDEDRELFEGHRS